MPIKPTNIENIGKKIIVEAMHSGKSAEQKASKAVDCAVTECIDIPAESYRAAYMPLKIGKSACAQTRVCSKIAKSGFKNPVMEDSLIEIFGAENFKKFESFLTDNGKTSEGFVKTLNTLNISQKEFTEYLKKISAGESIQDYIEVMSKDSPDCFVEIVKDIQNHRMIKEHQIFEPYGLSLSDTSELSDILRSHSNQKIFEFLEKKDKKLFEFLGGEYPFNLKLNKDNVLNEKEGKEVANLKLNALRERLFGVSSLDEIMNESGNVIKTGVEINGEEISFLCKGFKLSPSIKSVKIDQSKFKTLLESNMLTSDCLKDKEFLSQLPDKAEVISIKYKDSADRAMTYKVTFGEILDKFESNGIKSLNSDEIHVLTDRLTTAFDKMSPKTKQSVIAAYESKSKKIYEFLEQLKTHVISKSNARVDKSGQLIFDDVVIDDHCFMRMIDRNLANVVDYGSKGDTPKLLTIEKLLQKIVKELKAERNFSGNKTFEFQSLNENGIKVLANKDTKTNKITLNSVMQ